LDKMVIGDIDLRGMETQLELIQDILDDFV
jgi:hypothetical protein